MLSVRVMFVGEEKETITTVVVEVPENATIQDLSDFLKTNKQVPYKNFILTNNPKEHFKLSPQRTLKDLEPECESHEGKLILLCYETKLKVLPEVKSETRISKKNSNTAGCPCM